MIFCLLTVFMSHLHYILQNTRLLKEFFPLKTVKCDCKVWSESLMQWHNIPKYFFFAWYTPNWKKEQPSLHTIFYTHKERGRIHWSTEVSYLFHVSLILFFAIDWVGKVDTRNIAHSIYPYTFGFLLSILLAIPGSI